MESKQDVTELIIVGAGPAGITAAIYAARMKRHVMMFYETLVGQASLTNNIQNYPGFIMTSGTDLGNKLKEHLDDYALMPMKEKVIAVRKDKGLFEVQTENGTYLSKAVIIASGARYKTIGVPGEKEFTGKGVAYCAICDAPFFKDKIVSVVGGGNSALLTALELEKYAAKVYLVTINEQMSGEQTLIDQVKSSNKIEIIPSTQVKNITGEKLVKSMELEMGGKTRKLEVQGVFIEIGYVANSEIIDVQKNGKGEIIINERNETSIEGAYAAGDVTNTNVKQIIVAAGEGAKAALSASDYLSKLDRK